MKKLLMLLLVFTLLISGCLATVPPGQELPWNGISDPNIRRGIK
ncbi:MAG: hypothetical protein AB7S77_18600 [Desulfatirhabdiaceae bacterium]